MATRPAAIRASWSCWLRSVVTAVPPWPAASRSWIVGPGREDLLLELLLLRLEVERRLHQRRPLLAGDPDPRALGRELRRDQEAEHQQRDAERDLPGRDRADAGGERRHVGSAPHPTARDGEHGPRRRATTSASDEQHRADGRRAGGRRGRRVRRGGRRRGQHRTGGGRTRGRAGRGGRARRRSPPSPTAAGPPARAPGRSAAARRPRGRRASRPGTRRGPRPARAGTPRRR